MAQVLSPRDYIRISEAASILGVSEQTLRNWDKAGRLSAYRHPVNGYRHYRVADLDRLLEEFEASRDGVGEDDPEDLSIEELPPCHWSPAVALDPKHRPQFMGAPSTTVRRDWRKYPQEAHVLAAGGDRYRRLSVDEIAQLQGFDPAVLSGLGLTDRQAIAAVGDAVPPPLSKALAWAIRDVWDFESTAAVEICAGMGGLAEGSASAGFRHVALIERDPNAATILRHPTRPWAPESVHQGDVREFDYGSLGPVGLLAGGPPCQPWSQSGHGRGEGDPRDLLGWLPELLGVIRPEVFAFENVPGLLSPTHRRYVDSLVARLRSPAEKLSYGVLVGRVNAADYGVPQVRRRIVFLGFRGAPSTTAHACLERLWELRTHCRNGSPLSQWESVGSVVSDSIESGEWRRWIGR